MEDYKFIVIQTVVGWHHRFHSWLIAIHDNRALYKQFTIDQHLDKMEKENIGYKLPKSYPVITNEITRLYNIRDRIIIDMHHNKFASKQIAIDNRLKELENEHELLKNRRKAEKEDLDKLRQRKRSTSDSSNIIALESRISKAESTVNNTDSVIKNCENQVANLLHTKKDNLVNWRKQITDVEKTLEVVIGNYIKRATRKIESVYGFTEFTHYVAKYDAEMEKTVEGEY